jgi:hypothetical protein
VSGSWEIRKQSSILIGILHTETTTVAWAFGLRNLIVPGAIVPLSGMPFDHARNVAAMLALDHGAEWLGYLDSDVIPPRDAFVRLMDHNQPIVSGLYCRRSPPISVPVMIKNGGWLTQYPANRLIEVDYVGAGCLVVHRSVLEKMPPQRPEFGKHWFDWKVDMKGLLPHEECLSEDFSFCQWARRKLGVKVLVDTGIICRHVGSAQSLPGRFDALESTPNT